MHRFRSALLPALVALAALAAAIGWYRHALTERRAAEAARAEAQIAPKKGPSALELGIAHVFLQRGADLFNRGQYAAAIERYSDAIAADPTDANAYFLRGSAYWYRQQLNAAIADLSAAIEIKGQRPFYYSRCGAYFVSGEWDEAIADCSEAIRQAPMEADAYFLRAAAYYGKGDPEKSLADSLTVLMLHPNDPNARHLVDQILAQMDADDKDYGYSSLPVVRTEIDGGR